MPNMKWVIDGNDRTRFCEAIPLNYDEAVTRPERFEFGIQTRSADNECPELPAESSMCGERTAFANGRV